MIELCVGKGVGAGKTNWAMHRVIEHVLDGGTLFIADAMEVFPDKVNELLRVRYGVEMDRREGPKPPNSFDVEEHCRDENERRRECNNVLLEEAVASGCSVGPEQLLKYVEPVADDRWPQFRFLSRHDIHRVHEITAGGTDDCPVLIILDEVQDQLDSRDSMEKKKRDMFAWCCQSRHDNNDLIFLTQHEKNVDCHIARLATFVWRVRNMRNWSIPGLFRWPFKQFRWNKCDQDGKTLLDSKMVWFDYEIFKCFRSKAMQGKHKRASGLIAKAQLKKSKKGGRMLKYVLIFLVLFTGVMTYKTGPELGKYFGLSKTSAKDVSVTPPRVQAPGKVGQGVTPQATASPVPQVAAPTFRVEQFRGTDNHSFMDTERGQYLVGDWCPDGKVMRIADYRVEIVDQFGKRFYVVASRGDFKTQPVVKQAGVSSVTASMRR